ncbi:hypothetical protein K501DRAFT_312083 [Backusella circina FSU 941]|nr:hypothetical protein K501DRAFT_312083 [Backusella circina FSU 941]
MGPHHRIMFEAQCNIYLIKKSHSSYPISIKDGSLKIPPYLCSTSTVVYQDVIYAYGGARYHGFEETAALYSYTLNQTTGEMDVSLVSLNEGPICSTCSVVLYSDVGEIWVFAEPVYNNNSKFYTSNISQEVHPIVIPHIYHINSNSWSVLAIDKINGNSSTFYERVYQTTLLGNDGTVYVLGGAYRNESSIMSAYTGTASSPEVNTSFNVGVTPVITDGWYYNKTENSYNVMTLPTQDQYVYSAGFIDLHLYITTIHSDGNIGFFLGANSTTKVDYVSFYPSSKLNTYDIITKTWSVKNLTGLSADIGAVYGETALQVDYEKKLVYTMGGSFKIGSNSFTVQGFAVLDLVNNVWLAGEVQADSEPAITVYAAASALLMNNTYFVRLFGIDSDQGWEVGLNSVDILKLSFDIPFDNDTLKSQTVPIKWLNTILPPSDDSIMSPGMIIISVLFPVVTLSIMHYGVKVCNIKNVTTSPVLESSFSELVQFITIPDIRICFSGWNSSTVPVPRCYYDYSIHENCELTLLNGFNYTPNYPNALANPRKTICYLYAPLNPMNVTENNNKILITTTGFTYENNESIFIQLYKPTEDINRVVYLDQTLPGIDYAAVQEWTLTDIDSDLQVVASPNSHTCIEYQEINYQKINQDASWNCFGIFPVYSEFSNLTLDHTYPVIPNLSGSSGIAQEMFNEITITPKTFTKITISEKRDSTIIDIIGSIGGVLGLIVGLNIFLFGSRPAKPWGVIQRKAGNYKKLSNELESRFYLDEAQVPFVSPVHQRFMNIYIASLNEKQQHGDPLTKELLDLENNEHVENRLSRLEARNQLLEMVLRSYYIDDEIFTALDFARRNPDRYLGTVAPNTKKL